MERHNVNTCRLMGVGKMFAGKRCPTLRSRGRCAKKRRSVPELKLQGLPTRASPNSASGFLIFTVSLLFCLNDLSAHLVCHVEAKKVKDCGTTTGHVGLLARTLMKDAREGLIR